MSDGFIMWLYNFWVRLEKYLKEIGGKFVIWFFLELNGYLYIGYVKVILVLVSYDG